MDVTSLRAGANWATEVPRAIDEAVRSGFVLVLLTFNALTSSYVAREIEYALQRCTASARTTNIVPVIMDDGPGVIRSLPANLRGLQAFDLSTGSFEDRVQALVASLKVRSME